MSMLYVITAAILITLGILSVTYVDPLGIIAFICVLSGVVTLLVGATRYLWRNRNVFKK